MECIYLVVELLKSLKSLLPSCRFQELLFVSSVVILHVAFCVSCVFLVFNMVSATSLLQSVLGVGAIASGSTNLTELFGSSLSSNAQIIPPTTTNYTAKLTQRWTDYNRPSYPLGAIKPATEEDVQNIVKIATANDIPFFTTGGGHGISDYHTFAGLSIDLSSFNTVDLDGPTSTLVIGGSARIRQLIEPLAKNKKELALGSCECVGIVGATLGGGIGSLHGHRGILLDALESVRIVTANGDLLTASETENADLFWALRGAGSNYGIVTQATYKVYDASNDGMYTNADFVFPASANRTFFEILQSFDGDRLPSRLAMTAVAFYNRVTDQPVIALNAIYFGPQEEAEPLLQPFWDLKPTMSNISLVGQDQYFDAAFFNFFGQDNGACTPNQHINIFTVGLKQTHLPTFESFYANLTDFWIANPGYQGRWLMQRYPTQALQAVPDEATAYAYRDVQMYM